MAAAPEAWSEAYDGRNPTDLVDIFLFTNVRVVRDLVGIFLFTNVRKSSREKH